MKNTFLIPVVLIAGLAALPTVHAKVDFAKEIQPLLQQNCVKCHGTEKQKGKLRLDSREAALKGGKDGPALVLGDAEKSELIRRISLPKTDDDFMPSEGEPLKPAEIDLLKQWIKEGAEWPEIASAVKETPKGPPGPVLPTDFKPGPNEAKAISQIAQKGVDVRPVAMNSPWREANFRLQSTNINDAAIAPLKDITSLVDLNLATTKVTDAGLAALKPLTHLQRLHLELTGITDAGLVHVSALPDLVYLNLYGTAVTDDGLARLAALTHLRHLYVWQTKVTDAGAKRLKESLPNVEVSMGWDLAAFTKIEEERKKAEEKKKEEEKKKKEEKPAETKKDKPAAKKEAKDATAKPEEKKSDDKKDEPKKDDAKKEEKKN
jgi:hypothetical protein